MLTLIIRYENNGERTQQKLSFDQGTKTIETLEKKKIPFYGAWFGEDGFLSAGEFFEPTEWCKELKKIKNNRLPRIEDF